MIANTDGGVLPDRSERLSSRRSARPTLLSGDDLENALERTKDWRVAAPRIQAALDGYWSAFLDQPLVRPTET